MMNEETHFISITVQETAQTHQDPEPKTQDEPRLENSEPKTHDESKLENSEGEQSPRGVLEIPISDTSSVSSVSDNNNSSSSSNSSTSDAQTQRESNKENSISRSSSIGGFQIKGIIDVVKRKSMKKFSTSTIALFSNYDFSTKSLRRKLARVRSAEDRIDCSLLPLVDKPSWRNFGYDELAVATENFSPERLIGKGGHAEVYEGSLPDGSTIAVKRLVNKEKAEEERIAGFLSELGIIAHVEHPNAAKLIGFGVEGGLFLVLQFAPRGSLASCLHGSEECLEWKVRFKVAIGVAEGLSYLHHICPRRIIHRDITASNILLTEDYDALISDFGLAKWLPDKWLYHVVYPIEGTFGYLAPEYFMHGIVDEKTDVFAFGVLLLELITGRHAVDSSRQSLVMWAKPYLYSNSLTELVDPRIRDDYDPVEMRRAIMTASTCIHHVPSHRPHMNRVEELLKGEGKPVESSMKQKSTTPRSLLQDACDLDDYMSTNYQTDLNRHMQLVME